jgi:hypothetical protein
MLYICLLVMHSKLVDIMFAQCTCSTIVIVYTEFDSLKYYRLTFLCFHIARYDFARSIIDQLFGPKTHQLFPKKTRLDGGGCRGKGFYPSKLDTGDTDIEYEYDGVDVVIDEDSDVSWVDDYLL